MRSLASLVLLTALVGAATDAAAVIKVYDASKKPGDTLLYSSQLCPTIDTFPNDRWGTAIITDEGTGTVTLNRYVGTGDPNPIQFDLTIALGPGAFAFVSSTGSVSAAADQTGVGSTAPGSSAVWGILTGWVATGANFCASSPPSVCNLNTTPHGVTVAAIVNSPTYDLGTWSFESGTGDFEAAAPYIFGTNNGGTSNTQYLLRAAFVGASLPALPLVGFGALALGLLLTATRSLQRRL